MQRGWRRGKSEVVNVLAVNRVMKRYQLIFTITDTKITDNNNMAKTTNVFSNYTVSITQSL